MDTATQSLVGRANQAIADQLVLLPEEYSSIKIMYNKFNNATSYEPVIIEAYSEEAIKESRMTCPFLYPLIWLLKVKYANHECG